MGKQIIGIIVFVVFLLIPSHVLAADYEITNVDIQAYLQPDGDVTVNEQHTYEFSGEFGGIIRELIPKEGTDIIELEAFEGNTPLQIETDQSEHRIHREGRNETITIDLNYKIKNGVDVYADVAEFYWPFFDRSNESTYEQMTILVIPPEPTTDVIAFGYDEAYKTEAVLEDGQVQFAMGEVPRKRNGDIRVAYDVELFPTSVLTEDKEMHSAIAAAKQGLIDAEIAKLARKEWLESIGVILVPLFVFFLFFILVKAWLEARSMRATVMREVTHKNAVPTDTMSLPTTICYMNYHQLLPETTVAALLDLVRKGYVKKLDDKRFKLVNTTAMLPHEEKLVQWLFTEMGAEGEFSFDDIKMYLSNEKNHTTYQQLKANWQQAVKAELKEAGIYKNKVKYRFTIGFLSLLLVPFIVLFAMHDLISLTVLSIVISLGLLLFAIFYYPKTTKGLKLTIEWRHFKKIFPTMSESTWQRLTDDDRMRAFIFGLGSNEKKLMKKNESLVHAFNHTSGAQSSTAYGFDPTWLIIAAAATTHVQSAEETTGVSTSSGGISGGGSGTGGGGGGSGAF
ncbi:DUF2207 domain-containing protein [Bacillus sp. FJAT-45037]|uniref:DUF2207 domain-containing protein n=1 Tax=Bacillus sp. FJAT-45037 TaxID=2011007 RepID=UPI000C249BCC|nr:DUF2207 domain-containing protein [Bacillus sp. FJAT-45037]